MEKILETSNSKHSELHMLTNPLLRKWFQFFFTQIENAHFNNKKLAKRLSRHVDNFMEAKHRNYSKENRKEQLPLRGKNPCKNNICRFSCDQLPEKTNIIFT